MPSSCHGLYVTICLPTLVLIVQAIFLLECRQTDKQMQLNALPNAGGYTASVGNNSSKVDGCIACNAHNTVFSWKRSAISNDIACVSNCHYCMGHAQNLPG